MFDNSFNFGQQDSENDDTQINNNDQQNSSKKNDDDFFHGQFQEENDFGFGFGISQSDQIKNFSSNKNSEKHQDVNRQMQYVNILENIYNKQNQMNEENFYENESELVLNSYCQTSCRIDNAFLLLDMVMNKRNIQNMRRSFDGITFVGTKPNINDPNQKEDFLVNNQPDISEIIALKRITSAFSLMAKVIQPEIQETKRDMFNSLYNFSQNKAYEQQLVKIKEVEQSSEYKIKEKEFKIISIHEESINLSNKLKTCSQERDQLIMEVNQEEQKTTNTTLKNKSLEMVLIEKETAKYKRENRELKVKLDKKEKEVKRFMSEMNKILIHHEDLEASKRAINFEKLPIKDIEIRDSGFNLINSNR